jgi:hypothetical protein
MEHMSTRQPPGECEPSIVIDPVLFTPSDPALRARMRRQALRRDWPSYLAIVVSAAVIVAALLDLRMRYQRLEQASAQPTHQQSSK